MTLPLAGSDLGNNKLQRDSRRETTDDSEKLSKLAKTKGSTLI